MAKHLELKQILERFFLKNQNKGKNFIQRKFIALGVPKRSLDRWLKLLYQGQTLSRKVGSGRRPKIATVQMIKKLKKYFDDKSGMSQRKYANKIGCDHSYISKLLKNKADIRCFKKTKKPKMTAQQLEETQEKCDNLRKIYRNVDFILDDESYFTLNNTKLSGNDRFYSSDYNRTPKEVKYDFQMKYKPKVLLWITISPRGISQPYFVQSDLSVNQVIYRDNCLRSKQLPMINSLYRDEKYVSWTDKASAHFTGSVTKFLNDNNINFVAKKDNPVNIPQARPIEDCWAQLKQLVYQGDWQAGSIDQLKDRIKYLLKKIDLDFVSNLANSTHKRIREIAFKGITYNK